MFVPPGTYCAKLTWTFLIFRDLPSFWQAAAGSVMLAVLAVIMIPSMKRRWVRNVILYDSSAPRQNKRSNRERKKKKRRAEGISFRLSGLNLKSLRCRKIALLIWMRASASYVHKVESILRHFYAAFNYPWRWTIHPTPQSRSESKVWLF